MFSTRLLGWITLKQASRLIDDTLAHRFAIQTGRLTLQRQKHPLHRDSSPAVDVQGERFPTLDRRSGLLGRVSYTHMVSVSISHPCAEAGDCPLRMGFDPPKELGTVPLCIRHHRRRSQQWGRRFRLSVAMFDRPRWAASRGWTERPLALLAKHAASDPASGKDKDAHPCCCAPAGWEQPQSHAGQNRLVLVVSEIRSQEYRIREARAECTREAARLVGESDAYTGVAVEKENPVRPPKE